MRTIESGCSLREAGRRHGVSPATACEWFKRWRAASEERETLACLFDRSSRPRRSPRMLSSDEQARIVAAATRTRPSGRCFAEPAAPGRSASRASRPAATSGLPGDLLHADWTTLARFQEPGHAVIGGRRSSAEKRRRKLGYDVVHAIVDDHSRLAYAEVLPDAKATTVTAFIERGLAFSAHGIEASGP